MSVADAAALQMDTHSAMAPRLLALAKRIEPASSDARRALDLLGSWDGNVGADSVAATIYESWMSHHLGSALIARIVPPAGRKLLGLGSPDATLDVLEQPGDMLGDRPDALIGAIFSESLEATLDDLRERLGPDMNRWQWGRLHKMTLDHALAPRGGPDLAQRMRIGPVALGGSGTTPAMALYRGTGFAVVHGPSVRLVIDVGDWDKSLFVNMPGQSGDPDDPHYRDHLPGWLDGRFQPLVFSREAVMKSAERIIRLEPQR